MKKKQPKRITLQRCKSLGNLPKLTNFAKAFASVKPNPKPDPTDYLPMEWFKNGKPRPLRGRYILKQMDVVRDGDPADYGD